jgi:hypothetical protein
VIFKTGEQDTTPSGGIGVARWQAIHLKQRRPTIWVLPGSVNSSRTFLTTPKVAASAVECQSVTVKLDLDTVAVNLKQPTIAPQSVYRVAPMPLWIALITPRNLLIRRFLMNS